MQSHRGFHGRTLGAALALVSACFTLAAGAASGASQVDGCLPPPPTEAYSFKAVTDPCAPQPTYDWGVDPPYEGTTYASEADAQAGEGSTGTVQVSVTLPTWPSLYDWPNGHGYSGWASATSAPEGAYGIQSALGGQHGLWLWPAGGRQYGPGFAEWAFTAPGTTRISRASLSYAYRNKLLAHHCLQSGLRTTTWSTASFQHCKPIAPPDSQRDVSISLTDPASNPTSKQLYFRLQFPPCADPSSPSCTKNIAALDPLSTGGYARLKRVDMTLVDDDEPLVSAQGTFFWSQETYDLTVTATDAGAGVKRVTLAHAGDGQIAAIEATCDYAHRTDALWSRLCPESQVLTTKIDTSHYAEGVHTFTATATDVAGNVGTTTWTLLINRFPGTDPGEATGAWVFDPPVTIPEALAWAEQQGVRPIELVSQFPHGDETLTTGYRVETGAANADIAADYQDFVYNQFEAAAEEGFDNWSAYLSPALVYRIAFAPITVGGDSFYSFVARQQLRNRKVSTATTLRLSRTAVSVCYDPNVPWWPAFGRITTRAKTSGKYKNKRYVLQDFTYTERRLDNLKCLADDPTLELDAVYNRYKRGPYGDGKLYLGGIIQHLGLWNTGWKSSMPNAYLDTQWFDPQKGERAYTIGTEHANKLKPGVKYYTLIHTEEGDADSDVGYLQAQQGYRKNPRCYFMTDTFCINAERSAFLTPTQRTPGGEIDPWQHSVPGTTPWSGGTQRRP